MFIRRDVQGLWSGGHVLAWHLEQAFREDSAAWAKTRCLQWDVLEKKLPNFLNELIDCPCTLAQARADTGRFHVSALQVISIINIYYLLLLL